MRFTKQLCLLAVCIMALAACNSGPGTPAYSTLTPTILPPTFVPTLPPPSVVPTGVATVNASGFQPVSIGQGPCLGVKDPQNVTVPSNAPKQFSQPEQVIDATHTYCAILTTPKGRMVLQLYSQIAPKHVNSFVFLARQGYFDNTTWHRVVASFVIQGGDPTGTGSGGPGYSLPLEVSTLVKYDRDGVLGMARTDAPDTAGSQFFITIGQQPGLDIGAQGPGYTIFGQLIEGYDVVKAIAQGDKLTTVRIVDLNAQ